MLMTNIETDLPVGWTEKSDDTRRDPAIVEYQYETADDTRFIVSVMPQTAKEGYKLRLSTINPTSTHVRHDYPVDEYDAVEDAVEGAESFIDELSQRLQEGSISSADPEIEAIGDTIQAFRGNRLFPSVGQLLRRFS